MKKLLLLITTLLNLHTFAQTDREVVVKRILHFYDFNPMTLTEACNYGVLVPTNIPGKQDVIEYKYPGVKAHHFNKNIDNEYYLVWQNISFLDLQKSNLEVDVKVKIHVYDLRTAKQHPIKDTADTDTLRYLKNEDNFNIKAKNIKEAAAQITATDREEIVKAIFDFTIKSLDYHIFFYQDRGAKQALKDGKGDCTEYSELMITLCRAKKIPARIVMGLTPKSNGSVGHHNWVEVYFPQYGWVMFDPTHADSPTATTSFYKMKNIYVQLSYKRHITNFLSPCYDAGNPARVHWTDTCVDLTKGITKKVNSVYKYYNSFQLYKADALLDTILTLEPDNPIFLSLRGMILARQADFELANQYMQRAIKNTETAFDKIAVVYALSNYYALKTEPDSAIQCIKQIIDLGYNNYKQLVTDTDFYKMRTYPAFQTIVANLKQKAEETARQKK